MIQKKISVSFRVFPWPKQPDPRARPKQIDAIYDQGRLEFQTSITLDHQRFRVPVEIPDQEIADPLPPAVPTYDLADFSPEIHEKGQTDGGGCRVVDLCFERAGSANARLALALAEASGVTFWVYAGSVQTL